MSERRRNAFDRWLAGLRPALPADPAHAPDPEARCWSGKGCRPLTRAQFKRPIAGGRSGLQEIRTSASFADLLFPKTELEPGMILMKDLCSVGRLFDVSPAQTEGKPDRVIEDLHQRLVPLLRDVFPPNQDRPWIAQFFVYDRHHLGDDLQTLEKYLNPEARDSAYSKHWMEVLREHYGDACDENGFFFDPASQMPWKGKVRHIRLCVWRIEEPGGIPDGQHLDDLCERLSHSLAQVGIRLTPLDGDDLCRWLSDWFGPVREASDFPKVPLVATPLALLKGTALGDLAHRALRHGAPWSSTKDGCWHFHGRPHRFLTVNAILGEPQVGHLTAERRIGDRQQTLWDQMPEGTVWMMAVVFAAQDEILEHVARVKRNAVGSDPQAMAIRTLAEEAVRQVSDGNPILPVFSGVFVSAVDGSTLEHRVRELSAALMAHGIALIPPRDDPLAQDSYVRALPFNFDPAQDRRFYVRRSRLWFMDHMVRCLPVYGRTTGTQHPGLLAWNRGAEPLSFDPLNSVDRAKNAHLFVFGPTGSGKTAFLINTLLHTVAVHRPRLYLVTALPTFGLLAQHFQSKGLSVNHVNGDQTPIPPFADARLLLETGRASEGDEMNPETGRDLLGEMEIQARLMITGGDPKEEQRLVREDLNLIRKSLLAVAQAATDHPDEPVLTEDLSALMHQAAESGRLQNDRLSEDQRRSLSRMANAIELFCTGRAGQIFNRPGETWVESDVTVVELGALAHRRNEAWLAVAMSGLLSRINDQVQDQQYSARQTVVVLDEAHLFLKNPLISPYILSISAMWRTYGAWLWIATQNLRQVPETARELLNQPEWWVCMAMERDEVEMIGRFRRLDEEQKAMILSARKEPGKYTESVVLSSKLVAPFRNVVPALSMALSQTEKNEKAHRASLMRQHGCSELEAVHRISESIRNQRRGRKS